MLMFNGPEMVLKKWWTSPQIKASSLRFLKKTYSDTQLSNYTKVVSKKYYNKRLKIIQKQREI